MKRNKHLSYMPAKIKVNESMLDYALRLQDEVDKLKEIMISDGTGKTVDGEFFWWNESEWVLFNQQGND